MEAKILESPIASERERQEILKYIHFPNTGWDKFYRDELTQKDAFYRNWHIVMEENSSFIGHCHVCRSAKYPELAIFTALEVDNNFQRKGIAKVLYQHGMKILKNEAVELVMLATNFENPARKYIYLEDGFVDIFVGSQDEGRVAMAKSFHENTGEYIKNYLLPHAGKNDLRSLEYQDYMATDLVLNLKLNQVADKHTLPLNAWGKHGDYCLFRDHSLLVHRIKIKEVEGRVVDVFVDGL